MAIARCKGMKREIYVRENKAMTLTIVQIASYPTLHISKHFVSSNFEPTGGGDYK
jgi:hypothetical protein